MFENPRRGRQARNFTTNVSKILGLKSSSEQIFSRKLSLGAPVFISTQSSIFLKEETDWELTTSLSSELKNLGTWKKGENFLVIVHVRLYGRLFTVPYFFVRSYRYAASYRHGFLDFQMYRGGGRRNYSSGGGGGGTPLGSFDTQARWQPVTQGAWSRWSYGKIEDCEQSNNTVDGGIDCFERNCY